MTYGLHRMLFILWYNTYLFCGKVLPLQNGFQTQYETQLTGKAGNQTTNEIIQEIQSLTLAERATFNERLKPQILSEMKGSTYL